MILYINTFAVIPWHQTAEAYKPLLPTVIQAVAGIYMERINIESEELMKNHIKSLLKFTYFFTCCFFLLSNRAYAYIDPSTVTYIIQGVAGVLIAIGAAAVLLIGLIGFCAWFLSGVGLQGKTRKSRQQTLPIPKRKQNKAGLRYKKWIQL